MVDLRVKAYVLAMEKAGYMIDINHDEDGLANGVVTRFPDLPKPIDTQDCVPFQTAFPTAKQQSRAIYEFLRLRKLH